MRYREIPGTGVILSKIGFGCGGNAGLMIRGSAAEQRKVIARALELGINYFDVAPDYGAGRAEQALGDALAVLGARETIITTKVEIRSSDLPDIAGHIERSARESQRRLGRERIDVLQIHNGPTASPPPMANGDYHHLWIEHFLRPGGAVEGLQRLLRDGTVGHVGFVCRGEDVNEVRRLLETGVFSLINLNFSLINPSAAASGPVFHGERDHGGVIDVAKAAGCGVAVFSPLAGGLLSGEITPNPLSRPRRGAPSAVERAERFAVLARSERSMAQAAYQFVLDHPGVTTAIGGFSSIEQLEEIAAPGIACLSAADREQIGEIWRSSSGAVPA
ncbi:L-glyceraldehyde 3-phosphate reductase [Sphingomonas vulcanisoli]|uniref:L-glyceraldehyde 3-phosphate reductase n=1 Tax=Sphingomonas vulcanisoli TaxID=1658060 RepID=A0ABX0TXX3_9SPHN|nr:aldo/keto reductase [Sphingomonas vulcanisoli]NIJ09240.1 L-glyceraldehyde 3-phosphate reductase [Sphingomonas vulcanisoli]